VRGWCGCLRPYPFAGDQKIDSVVHSPLREMRISNASSPLWSEEGNVHSSKGGGTHVSCWWLPLTAPPATFHVLWHRYFLDR